MDWNLGGTIATLVSVDDGTVSFYMSSGGGIIGAGTHRTVAEMAAPFREQARAIMAHLSPTATFPPPARNNNVVFYVVTDAATFTSGELDVGPRGLRLEHPLAPLFNAAHELIAEIRRVAPR